MKRLARARRASLINAPEVVMTDDSSSCYLTHERILEIEIALPSCSSLTDPVALQARRIR
jgi:hypothetical protein